MFIPYGDDIEKRHPPFATIFLIAVNVLVSMYEYRLFQDEPHSATYFCRFVEHWALIPQELAQGRVIGLFTSMFLHADLMHLLGNMFTLWLFAWTIEMALGTVPFLILYFFWGMVAAATHAAFAWHSPIPCVGASGAIFGVVGAYFVTFGITAQVKCLWNGGILTGWRWVKFQMPAGAYMFFWMILPQVAGVLGIGEEEGAAATGGGIAWYAHAGGFAAGALSMVVFGADAMRKVRMNREGQWEVHSTAVEAPPESEVAGDAEVAAADSPFPEAPPYDGPVCQYCQRPLEDAHKMDETLYRCANPDCKRLTYVNNEPAPAPTKSGRWQRPPSLFRKRETGI
jgi:membrane associated rhomboid family serine protease